jgi:AcrR family transcriptional regulator
MDPARTRRKRAPRNSLSRASILRAAIGVLDERGPEALTMRSLAQDLGVRPMALYNYFSSKDQLLDAVREQIMGELAAHPDEGDWAERLRCVGVALYRLLVSHPALIHLFATRPLAGHEAADAAEAHLHVLREAGFDRATTARAHLTLLHHALGSATWEVQLNAGRGTRSSRARRRKALQQMRADRYPTLVELADELVTDTVGEQQFAFGLEVILTGLRTRLDTPHASGPRGGPEPRAGR